MVTRIPALIFDGIVEIGCLYFLYLNMTGLAVGKRGNIEHAGEIQSDFGYSKAGRLREYRFFIQQNSGAINVPGPAC